MAPPKVFAVFFVNVELFMSNFALFVTKIAPPFVAALFSVNMELFITILLEPSP